MTKEQSEMRLRSLLSDFFHSVISDPETRRSGDPLLLRFFEIIQFRLANPLDPFLGWRNWLRFAQIDPSSIKAEDKDGAYFEITDGGNN